MLLRRSNGPQIVEFFLKNVLVFLLCCFGNESEPSIPVGVDCSVTLSLGQGCPSVSPALRGGCAPNHLPSVPLLVLPITALGC